jgi:hypothetical protein
MIVSALNFSGFFSGFCEHEFRENEKMHSVLIPGTSLVAPLDGSGDPDASLELQLLEEVTDEGGKLS